MPGTGPGMTNRKTVTSRVARERLKAGDTLRSRVTESGGPPGTTPANDADNPFATFSEWSNEADEKTFTRRRLEIIHLGSPLSQQIAGSAR